MYPLPMAPQECYTKWFQHTIKNGPLKNYQIIWVGKQLSSRFKFDTTIGPEHIFIAKKDDFEYIVIDKNDNVHKLPKKCYTTCFPGIQYGNVPKNNRMQVKLTNKIKMTLPYIPQAFLESKKQKTRKRRRVISSKSETDQNMDFNQRFPQWHVLQNGLNNTHTKKELMLLVRSIIKYADKNNNYCVKDPFEGIKSIQDIKKNKELLQYLKTICGFVYHYCRSELGIVHDATLDSTEYLLKMNSVE